jgi:hypothetical protein
LKAGLSIGALVIVTMMRSIPAAAATAASGTPPKVLNIVRQKLKPGAAPSYAALEASIVNGYARAKIPLYWIALQSTRDPANVLYLNFYEAPDDADRATQTYTASMKKHPDLVKLQQRLASLGQSPPVTSLTARRDELVYSPNGVDLSTMNALRVTVFRVRAGHEGDFVDAAQTGRAEPWLLYEDTSSSTFFIIAPLRSTADRKAGALPRGLRRLKGIYTAEKPMVYAVRHAMSHAWPELAAANRKFRRSTPTH